MFDTAARESHSETTMVEPQPVALKQQAYDELKRLILSEELPPGTVQSVRQLAARLKMSKTPVHSAIERLETDGLVTLAPQQGVVVRDLSMQDIINHYEIRQAIEPFVVERLAGRLSSEQIGQLRQNLDDLREASRRGEVANLIRIDGEFHQLLCGFQGNDEIIHVMRRLQDRVQRVIHRVVIQFPERISESYGEHKAIVDALIEGDGQMAAELMDDHLNRGLRRFWPTR